MSDGSGVPPSIPALSARLGRSAGQRVFSIVVLVAVIIWGWKSGWAFFDQLGIVLMFATAGIVAAKVVAVLAGLLFHHTLVVSDAELVAVDPTAWPTYTVLVPLYREAEIVPELIAALERLDYPRDRLQVLLLLEADDVESRAAVDCIAKPEWIEAVIVEPGTPRTKPRACNVGLDRANGSLVVIFDAEDRPEPDQLKKAAAVFLASEERVACLQAKLNCFNRKQSLIARCFTMEYSAWFDLYLPGLHAVGAPIPLGGTSNHFRTDCLRRLGGWDAWNVTEDCDLGLRLARAHLETRILESTTWEEAPTRLGVWMKQRSRWMKGYWQTHIAHTRNPWRTVVELGCWRSLLMLLTIGGQVLGLLLAPVALASLVVSAHDGWRLFDPHRPATVVLIVIAVGLGLANVLFVLIHALAAARRGFHDLLSSVMLLPFYWLAMSAATWRGFWQSFSNPFLWEKTPHGASAHRQMVAAPVPVPVPVKPVVMAAPGGEGSAPIHSPPRRSGWSRRIFEIAAITAALVLIATVSMQSLRWLDTDRQIRFAAIDLEVPDVEQEFPVDQSWVDREKAVFTVALAQGPEDLALLPVFRAVAYLKVLDGEWYQLESTTIRRIANEVEVEFPLDGPWRSCEKDQPWQRDVLRRVRTAGIRLYGADMAIAKATIVEVNPAGRILQQPLSITLGAVPPATQRAMLEIPFDLSRSFANPFDTREISVDCIVTDANNHVTKVPAFYTQDYRREANVSQEHLRAIGAPHWAARWTPEASGTYRLRMEATMADGSRTVSSTVDVPVQASANRGFARIDADRHSFCFDDGSFLYPMSWNIRSPRDDILSRIADIPQPENAAGAIAMEDFVNRLADAKQNIGRVWMSPWFGSLEWDRKANGYHGLGQYNLQNAWRLDRVLSTAAKRGVLIELALHHHGPFTEAYDSQWKDNPYNVANGGPLVHPAEVMVNAEAKRLFADRLRYIAARWGADPALFAWTMWIEVDTVAKGPATTAWHIDMAHRLREWDQGKHIISTEFCNSPGIDELWRSPEIEYVQMGGYSFGAGLINVLREYARDLQYGKPLIIEEYGGHAQGGSAPWIAHELHDGPWAGWMLPYSGAPMPWWWTLAFHYHLEDRHRRFADFIANEDLRGVAWRYSNVPVLGADGLQAMIRSSPDRVFAWVYAPSISNFNIRERQYWKKVKAGEELYAKIIGDFDSLAKDPGNLFPPTEGASLRLNHVGLAPGRWRAEFWDTWSDAEPDITEFLVAEDGSASLPLPRLVRDCAIKLNRLP